MSVHPRHESTERGVKDGVSPDVWSWGGAAGSQHREMEFTEKPGGLNAGGNSGNNIRPGSSPNPDDSTLLI